MLEIIGVSKKFTDKFAVNNVNLTIGDGEFVSMLGPSGCGKTTILRIIAGLETADSGSIRLNGQDITLVEAHKRNIHTVFQKYALFPHMNIFDNVAFGLRCKRVSESEIKGRVKEVLELANLQGQEKRNVTTLSGGEQQRVALVRALVNMPKLLLLDEPLGALDQKLRLQMQQELVAIQKRVKITFVFVTHDQQEALNISDRVAVIYNGKIEQVGTSIEIYEYPKTFFVASFVGAMNRLDGILTNDISCEVQGLGTYFVDPRHKINGTDTTKGAICLRPEKVMIFSRRPSTVENIAEGVIRSQTYLGTHTQFEVTLKNGANMMVFQQNSQKLAKKVFLVNDRVYVGWQTNSAHFFSKSH